MRSEKEMLELILGVAEKRKTIRAVVMNGSRANPKAPRDIFQDFDIIYYVTSVGALTHKHNLIDEFGPRIMLQMPELGRDPVNDGHFTYLILLEDGNRIDLSLYLTSAYDPEHFESQSILLLDKDRFIKPFPPADDRDFWLKRPSTREFESCCNNFLWCSQNVAKGIWRDELPYALFMLDKILREELEYIVGWYIGITHGFDNSPGKAGKYYKAFLTPGHYALLLSTYPVASARGIWDALSAMHALFSELARAVGEKLEFDYPEKDDAAMIAYLERVKNLPKDATEIF